MLVFKNGSLSRERVLKEACGGQWDTWAKMLAGSLAVGVASARRKITENPGIQVDEHCLLGARKSIIIYPKGPSTQTLGLQSGFRPEKMFFEYLVP